jgi:hypothetical protein
MDNEQKQFAMIKSIKEWAPVLALPIAVIAMLGTIWNATVAKHQINSSHRQTIFEERLGVLKRTTDVFREHCFSSNAIFYTTVSSKNEKDRKAADSHWINKLHGSGERIRSELETLRIIGDAGLIRAFEGARTEIESTRYKIRDLPSDCADARQHETEKCAPLRECNKFVRVFVLAGRHHLGLETLSSELESVKPTTAAEIQRLRDQIKSVFEGKEQ